MLQENNAEFYFMYDVKVLFSPRLSTTFLCGDDGNSKLVSIISAFYAVGVYYFYTER